MATIDAIEIPKLLFDEGAAPSTPASTNVALYAKSDGLLYSKDDAGVEKLVSGGASASGYLGPLRILATVPNTFETLAVNSTSYVNPGSAYFAFDWDQFPATHFMIYADGQANEASQTVKIQLALKSAHTTPYSAAGDDVTITNTAGQFTSGWVALAASHTGIELLCLAFKGSTATVDLSTRWVEIHFKY